MNLTEILNNLTHPEAAFIATGIGVLTILLHVHLSSKKWESAVDDLNQLLEDRKMIDTEDRSGQVTHDLEFQQGTYQ